MSAQFPARRRGAMTYGQVATWANAQVVTVERGSLWHVVATLAFLALAATGAMW